MLTKRPNVPIPGIYNSGEQFCSIAEQRTIFKAVFDNIQPKIISYVTLCKVYNEACSAHKKMLSKEELVNLINHLTKARKDKRFINKDVISNPESLKEVTHVKNTG